MLFPRACVPVSCRTPVWDGTLTCSAPIRCMGPGGEHSFHSDQGYQVADAEGHRQDRPRPSNVRRAMSSPESGQTPGSGAKENGEQSLAPRFVTDEMRPYFALAFALAPFGCMRPASMRRSSTDPTRVPCMAATLVTSTAPTR